MPSVNHSFRKQQPLHFSLRCLIAGTSEQEAAKIAEELQNEGELLPPAISHHPRKWQLYEIACIRVAFRTSARSWQPVGSLRHCLVTLFGHLQIECGPVRRSSSVLQPVCMQMSCDLVQDGWERQSGLI